MTQSSPLAVVILAAGKGTRMKSDKPKVMHEVLGLPMVNWVVNAVQPLSPERTIVVVGKGMPELEQAVQPAQTIIQDQQNGTGSALKAAMPLLKGFEGDVLVLLGDTPLISTETLEGLIKARHHSPDTGLSVLGVRLDNPFGYGRLLMADDGALSAIREEKDASDAEKQVDIVNTGAFCLDGTALPSWLEQLDNNNAQKEYYITDLPEIAAQRGSKTAVSVAQNADEVKGCNTRLDLSNMQNVAQQILRNRFIEDGVVLQDAKSVYFYYDTVIGAGTLIEPHVYFGPGVHVERDVHIKAFCHFEGARIGAGTTIGPFARLRPGSDIGTDVRIGNFVEIKKSQIGRGSKISHLGYVGDCVMGEDVNFSCGAITVNYDGYNKHQTTIGNGVMVGSNVNLIAPVELEDGAFVAAGSTITTDVPTDALAMERGKTELRAGWSAQYRARKEKT